MEYLGERCVSLDGAFSRWARGTSGIIAGCGNAGTILLTYLKDSVEKVVEVVPECGVRVLMDDIQLEAQGSGDAAGGIARALAMGAAQWADCMKEIGG
eukprot:8379378-Alexandrium_andersonii.AAC.1